MREVYRKVLDEQRLAPSVGEKNPEILAEKIWESIVKKLQQKDYKYDAGFYGALPDYCRKIGLFYHASLQGTGCYPGAASTLRGLQAAGIIQGLLGDGQSFTAAQLARSLSRDDPAAILDDLVAQADRVLSFAHRARKPSDTLFGATIEAMGRRGIEPEEILHVGSSLTRDLGPAKKWGMKTALYAGDRLSLSATAEQLRDPQYRPDALLTELGQVPQLLG
jgi:FMN phosphatase YigB (HAD superfamily)